MMHAPAAVIVVVLPRPLPSGVPLAVPATAAFLAYGRGQLHVCDILRYTVVSQNGRDPNMDPNIHNSYCKDPHKGTPNFGNAP